MVRFIFGLLLMIIHLSMVTVSGAFLLFSENVQALCFLAVVMIVVFGLLIVNNGCIGTQYELKFAGITLTEFAKKLLFISDNVSNCDFEKMIIGIPLLLTLLKIIGLTLSTNNNANKNTLLKCLVRN
jgi:hypothetical protein